MFRPLRSLVFLVALTIAGLIGRATVIESAGLALIWPAGGVAALWLMWSTWRQRIPDLALLAVAIFALNAATGAPLALSIVFVFLNCLQAAAFVLLLDRWCPRLDGSGGDLPLSSTRKLVRFLAAAAIASAVGVLVGWCGFVLVADAPDAAGTALWWGRQMAGLTVVALTGQLVWHAWSDGSLLRRRDQRPLTHVVVEVGLLVTGSTVLYLLVFVQSSLPLAFMPAVASVWAGLRLTPAWTALHGTFGSAAVIAFTVSGTGPFALAPGPVAQASMAQLLIAVLMLTGLSLAVSVRTNELAVVALRQQESRTREEAATARAQADLLSAINRTMVDALVVFSDDGRLLTANAAAEQLLALPGRLQTDQRSESHVGELTWEEIGVRAVAGDLRTPVDLTLLDAEGRRRVMSSVARRLPDGGAVLVLSDVTEERQRTDELASFAGVVAHDLRNPIGVVRGWADELRAQIREGVPAEELMPIGTAIEGAAQRMEDLIGDLLDHATSRDRSLDVEAVDVSALVDEVAAARGVSGLVVGTRFDPVAVDRSMLRQLLDNLIGNAVKYVAAGVVPRIEVTGLTDAETGLVTVNLVDNGIGVPEEQRQTIFQQFQRAHRAGYQGTGLGLAICRTIVERHGGDIGVDPGPAGIGSRFWFTVPVSRTAPDQPAEAAVPQPRRLRGVEVA